MRQSAGKRAVRAFLSALMAVAIVAVAQDSTGDIRPAPYQVVWQDLEFGVILHFGNG